MKSTLYGPSFGYWDGRLIDTGGGGLQVHGVSFKKRAPRAIKAIREFAVKAMVGLPIPPSFLSFVACLLACLL